MRAQFVGWFMSWSGVAHPYFYSPPSRCFPQGFYMTPCGHGHGVKEVIGKPKRPCSRCMSSLGLRVIFKTHKSGATSIERPVFGDYREVAWPWDLPTRVAT